MTRTLEQHADELEAALNAAERDASCLRVKNAELRKTSEQHFSVAKVAMDEVEALVSFLKVIGYHRCDSPACNCGAWHRTRPQGVTVADLLAEVKRLGGWVDDLQSGMYINCVYCGHRYGPQDNVPSTMAAALKQHVERCKKHPMSALKTANEHMQAVIEAAEADLVDGNASDAQAKLAAVVQQVTALLVGNAT